MTQSPQSPFEKLTAFLDEAGVAYQLHDHSPIRTVHDAQAKWPLAVERLLKTIAFRHKEGEVILVAVHALSRIDYARLAAELGIKRRELASLAPDELETMLGVAPGEVFPLPLLDNVGRIIFDKEALLIERCYCGSGRLDKTLEIETRMLIELAGGMVASVTK